MVSTVDPSSLGEVDKWQQAIHAEHVSLMKNQTQKLQDLPPCRYVMSCTFLIRKKYNSDGTLASYKV